MAEVICVGSAVLDHIYDVPALASGDDVLFALGYRQAGAGSAANAAIGVSRLGGEALIWSRLGDDETGDIIVAGLVRHGVDASGVRRITAAQSSISSVLAAPDGQRQITRFDGTTLPDDTGWLPLGRVQDTGAVLAEALWTAAAQAALDAARDHRIPGILTVGAMPQPVPVELVRSARFIVFSPAGLAQFTGGSDPASGLAEAGRRSGATVGVTSGADGFHWLDEDGSLRHQPRLPVGLVDPTVTWDVFCGAFALALGEEKDLETAIRFAVTAAGLTGTEQGGRTAIPDRRTVWQRLEADFEPNAGADG